MKKCTVGNHEKVRICSTLFINEMNTILSQRLLMINL